ncbi:Nuclear RNA export factor 1 [Gryllus bimaculatus]|nr:Nuclear RNA export factor 1 [Gryllus bimaculatus]
MMTGGEASLKLRMNMSAGVFVKEVKVGVLQASEGRPCGALIKAAFVNLLVVSSSEVRKIFPKVIRLDGADLPPPIVFDVSEEVKLPPYVVSFVCSPEGQQVAKQFLEQYFNIYDSDNRQAIGDAYHENAHFSLAITLPKGDGNHKLNQYMPDNRNLMRVRDANRRMKLLINGKENIISKLKELPLTKHDLASFTVDLPIFNPQLMFLNISGIFIERKLHLPTRYFSRTFVIVPLGGGFVIINDLLNITNATEKQAKMFGREPMEFQCSRCSVHTTPQ